MEHAKSAQEIQQDPKECDQLIEPRARPFQKNFIGALRRRSHG
jgi:hypothetical protein